MTMTESLVPESEVLKWAQELSFSMEAIELHHEKRDQRWLRPEELRGLLRQMCYLLLELSVPSEVSSEQK